MDFIMSDATAAALHGRARDEAVDCAGCTACCRGQLVVLTTEDDVARYDKAVAIPVNPLTGQPGYAIPIRSDGACVYLGDRGCTIYDQRPAMCRAFSCIGFVRSVIAKTTRAERRHDLKTGELPRAVWEAGTSRLHPSRGGPCP